MRIEKKTLNDALRVLGKVVCQTSPVELYRSVRFVGDVDGVMVQHNRYGSDAPVLYQVIPGAQNLPVFYHQQKGNIDGE